MLRRPAAPPLEHRHEVVAQRLGLAAPGPAVVGQDDVAVHVEENAEPGGSIPPGDLAELGRAWVRGLGHERPEPELDGVAQEGLGPLTGALRGCGHGRLPSEGGYHVTARADFGPGRGALASGRSSG
jgi:hypothetical protein